MEYICLLVWAIEDSKKGLNLDTQKHPKLNISIMKLPRKTVYADFLVR